MQSLLLESGPTLAASFFEADLVDKLLLFIAPTIAGGEGPRVLEGALADIDEVELAWLLEAESELFARYRGITAGPGGAE